ncbi:MAG: cyclic nucleotide-binding domain-containing protein [Myxococcales bacterium]|nr:cyclic nucleotide-binding domain-containing protein [Myxococcales bacterium]
MGTHPSVDRISELVLFAGLDAAEHARLASIAWLERLDAGTRLFAEGDPPGDLYVLLDGRVLLSVEVPGEPDRSLMSLRGGELLGWTSLLGRTRVATATAVLESEVLRLPRSDLLEICETDHHVGYAIMRQAFEEMADRLVATRLQLLDVFGPRRS